MVLALINKYVSLGRYDVTNLRGFVGFCLLTCLYLALTHFNIHAVCFSFQFWIVNILERKY